MIDVGTFESPIGPMLVASRDGSVTAIIFAPGERGRWQRLAPRGEPQRDRLDPAVAGRLRAYFDGDVGALDDLRAEPHGTPFQQRVWSALRRIRPGETWSYRQLAEAIGAPSAVRAVGAANGANPIPLVIPCHRVIGSNGQLVGYGGGLDRKRWLLAHEGVRPASLLDAC